MPPIPLTPTSPTTLTRPPLHLPTLSIRVDLTSTEERTSTITTTLTLSLHT